MPEPLDSATPERTRWAWLRPDPPVQLGKTESAIVWAFGIFAGLSLLALCLPAGRAGILTLPFQRTQLPLTVLAAGAGAELLGWWLLLGGGALAGSLVRWTALGAFMIVQFYGAIANLGAWTTIPATLYLALLAQRGRLRTERAAMLAAAAVVLLFAAATLLTGWENFALFVLILSTIFQSAFMAMIFLLGPNLGTPLLGIARAAVRGLLPCAMAGVFWWAAISLLIARVAFFALDGWGEPARALIALLGLVVAYLAVHRGQVMDDPPQVVALILPLVIFAFAETGRGLLLPASAVASVLGAGLLWFPGSRTGQSVPKRAGGILLLCGLWGLFLTAPAVPAHFPAVQTEQGAARALDMALTAGGLALLIRQRLRRRLDAGESAWVILSVAVLTLTLGIWGLVAGLSPTVREMPAVSGGLVILVLAAGLEGRRAVLRRSSPLLPKISRLLLLLGSGLLLVGAAVLGLGSTGELGEYPPVAPFLAQGLVLIGIPLLLHRLLLAFAAAQFARSRGESGG